MILPVSSHSDITMPLNIQSCRAMSLVLLWFFTAYISFFTLGFERVLLLYSYLGIAVIFVPIAGWIGDTYLGRYRVIKYSMRILWVFLISCEVIITLDYIEALSKVLSAIVGIGAVASIGILANIIQFGIDQFPDASSTQISGFIQWTVWIMYLAESVFLLTTSCICGLYSDYIPLFLLPLMCTVSIVCDIFWGHWLIKEPVKNNPLKQIFQVLKYAIKNKYPRLRSAFTYWEDKPYSRIDLGKSKYGGPFTTEQVEDVKTFFRLLLLLLTTFPLFCLVVGILLLDTNKLYIQFRSNHSETRCLNSKSVIEYMKYCLNATAVQFSNYFSIAVLFPAIKLIQSPLLKKFPYLVDMSLFHRVLFGLFILLLFEVSLITIEVVSLHLTPKYNNLTCILIVQEGLPSGQLLNLDMNWIIIPQTLLGASIFLMLSSTIEFLYAQAPLSMRGFFFGLLFLILGVSYGIANLFSHYIPKIAMKYVKSSSEARNCNIWYLGIVTFLTILLLCGGFVMKKLYKPRKRDENWHNTQKFAIEYFDKYHSNFF